jgi:hypothetical protein
VWHPASPRNKTPIPHHERMATPADTMSGIVRDRVDDWSGLSGLRGSAVFSDELAGWANNWRRWVSARGTELGLRGYWKRGLVGPPSTRPREFGRYNLAVSSTTDLGVGVTLGQTVCEHDGRWAMGDVTVRTDCRSIGMKESASCRDSRCVTVPGGRVSGVAICNTRLERFRPWPHAASFADVWNDRARRHLGPKSRPTVAAQFCTNGSKALRELEIRQSKKKNPGGFPPFRQPVPSNPERTAWCRGPECSQTG